MLALFRTLAILLLLLVLAFASAILTMHLVIHGAEVTVPDLRGQSVGDAEAQMADLGLGMRISNHLYSDAVTAGKIIAQTPAPGTRLRKGWTLQVVESLGAQKVSVPDLTGTEERIAILALHAHGLQLGSVAYLPSPDQPANTVLAQSPEAWARNIASPSVNLLLAAPAPDSAELDSSVPPGARVMPDLTGMPLKAAERALWTARFKLGKVTRARVSLTTAPAAHQDAASGGPKPGSVLVQSPQAGYAVAPGATVTLTIAR